MIFLNTLNVIERTESGCLAHVLTFSLKCFIMWFLTKLLSNQTHDPVNFALWIRFCLFAFLPNIFILFMRVVQYTQSDTVWKFPVSICTVRLNVPALYGPYGWNWPVSNCTLAIRKLRVINRTWNIFYFCLCQGGLTDHVDPYGPYRWNRLFSIRTRSENCMSLMGLNRMFFTFAWIKGVWQIMSIRTVRTDGIGCSQSVYDPKMGLRIYFTSYLCQGALTDHVHPYGPYRWNRPFSIRIRSENCMSLMVLRISSRLTWLKGLSRVVDPFGPYGWNRPFQSVHDTKMWSD